jgi:glycosyltransferase involved in cell wall biosynthesis
MDNSSNVNGHILLCAYACDPTKGSEPGGGWEWAVELSRYRHITVVTRSTNRKSIDAALERFSRRERLNFLYFDLPIFFQKLKKGDFGTSWYYYLWQLTLGLKLRREGAKRHFSYAHHITFGAAWRPSALCLSGIPYLLGPVGGAELIPFSSWPILGFREALFEVVRRVILTISLTFDPFVVKTLKNAGKVLATSTDTFDNLPSYVRQKCTVFPQFGIRTPAQVARPIKQLRRDRLDILFAGRLYRRKGIFLALEAFHEHRKSFPDSRMTVLCPPPYGALIQDSREISRTDNLSVISRFVSRDEIKAIYAKHDIFLYPSLRDAWGRVILEAMSESLIPIVLNCGGPAEIVTKNTGFLISSTDRKAIVSKLTKCLNAMAVDPDGRSVIAQSAYLRMQEVFSWEALAGRLVKYYPPLVPWSCCTSSPMK